jgi:hypothetical protein
MRAAFAEVKSTNWSSEMRPAATPSEYSMGISVSRSATPCRAVTALSAGSSLASSVHGAWSLHSVSMSPAASPAQSASRSDASRSGGAPAYFPASGSAKRSLVRCRYSGRVST